jgi:hypothetical protein
MLQWNFQYYATVKPLITKLQCFPLHRIDINYTTVRAGSTNYMIGGSLHRAIGLYVHPLYNINPMDYDVAVLVVCTDFDIPVDSEKYVTCLY